MPCTPFSRQKRARRADPPTTPTAVPDWTSLTDDLVRRVGDCLLATDDIDCYMAFRAVCHDWRRSATKDDHPSSRFHPSKWALLDRRDDVLTLVNVETGRFLRRRIPLLRDCFFVGATAGGLLLLGESAYPYQARVFNPFTGSLAHFKAPVPVGQAREVAVVMTSSTTMRVFVSTALGAIMWADQDSDYFHKCDAPFPNPSDLLCMVPFAGNVYLTNRQGSVLSISTAVGGVAGQGQRRRRSAETISSMAAATIIPASVEGGRSYYLVESGVELFLVTRPWYGVPGQLEVHRVDTMRKALEPVRSIGNRALFLSHVRCLSVDADKFRTVEAGCIYFVDQIVAGGSYFECSFMTTVRFPDGVQQPALDLSPVQQGCFRPFSLTHAFANYCKFIIQYSELRRKMIDDDEDFSDDYGYSDEEDFSDDYESDDGGSSESDQ
uniref:KIB1-4 beta-propeller domain-containing protein n=1 Tax=Setaria viridis TaxID=4556 RepID=A0A4U6UU00_SETVI|nr:hypothetical protein SEVIR_5G465100v2 [Setaria viridis]